jgi:hypothetical protein
MMVPLTSASDVPAAVTSPGAARAVMKAHIDAVAAHFGGRIHVFDVVNEPTLGGHTGGVVVVVAALWRCVAALGVAALRRCRCGVAALRCGVVALRRCGVVVASLRSGFRGSIENPPQCHPMTVRILGSTALVYRSKNSKRSFGTTFPHKEEDWNCIFPFKIPKNAGDNYHQSPNAS